MSTLHVVPVADAVAHDTSTDQADCLCGPATQPCRQDDGSVDWLIVHASLDGREQLEGGAL